MAVKIIGLIIGILVTGAGVYYLAKEKDDPESKKSTRWSASLARWSQLPARCCWHCKSRLSFAPQAGFVPRLRCLFRPIWDNPHLN